MSYKGFNPGLICLGKQYKEYTLFEEPEFVLPCEYGMHFCEDPLEVFSHYPLINASGELNEMAEVFSKKKAYSIDGKKFCTSSLYVDKKLSLYEIVQAAFKFKTRDAPMKDNTRAWQASSVYATHISSVTNCAHIATASNYSVIVTSGRFDHIVTSGDNCTVLATGEGVQIAVAGDCGQIVTEGDNVAIVASGKYSHIHTLGDFVRINCSGAESAVVSKGRNAIISATGRGSKINGSIGDIITLSEWCYNLSLDRMVPANTKTSIIDGEIIKENIFYTLCNGEFVEAGKD
jgi:hypothetical protein